MPVSLIDSNYYRDMFGTKTMRSVFSDEERIMAWLKVEAALAKAQAKAGIFDFETARKIREAAQMGNIDSEAMKAEFDKVGFPILPFVHQLTAACDPETARWVHYGATTQDILDTGTVLQIKKGIQIVEEEVSGIIKALAKLSDKHRNTVMAGRTFQQFAAPVTLGYKTAIWLDELLRHRDRLSEMKPRLLTGQCSGAVGTFATLGEKGPEVQKHMMEILGLEIPAISWHVARDRWAELIATFAMIAATLGKIANETGILMRSEIGELSEPYEKGRGASTTLPQKRNPISCEPIIAISVRLRELASSQFSAMIQEHERPIGPLHLEWMIIPDAFVMLSGSLKHSRFIIENLVVDPQKMRQNLSLNGGLIMSEAVMMGLAPKIGKKKAHDLVNSAADEAWDKGVSLKEALLRINEIMSHLSEQELDDLLNPLNYIGMANKMIDTVLSKLNY